MRFKAFLFGSVALGFLVSTSSSAQISVLESRYDAARTGSNLQETQLNTSNVKTGSFGLLYNYSVDDQVYAQPLYAANVTIPNQGTHNVLYVATMHDTLYAFDADVPGSVLWSANLAPAPSIVETIFNLIGANGDISGNIGIESTPVIDASTNTLYLVARTRENGVSVFRLHALDITSGQEKFGGPVIISGSYSAGGKTLTFNPALQNQRAGLALAKGKVIVSFGSNEDIYQYYGWVMAYDTATLKQSGVFVSTPTADHGGGIWQSGRAPAVDSTGNVYFFVGNAWGTNAYDGVNNFGESVIKLDPAQNLKLVDWFTPTDWQYLDTADLDLSSSGPMLIPGTSLLAGGGKNSYLYLLQQNNLGKFVVNDTQVTQKLSMGGGEIRGGQVFWPRSSAQGGSLLYNWSAATALRAYAFNGSTLNAQPVGQSSMTGIYPGGEMTLSANGTQTGTGVIWSSMPISQSPNQQTVPGILRAFNAENVNVELWNSQQTAGDSFGNVAKFVPPVVANGKVYVATFSNQVSVYGLKAGAPANVAPVVNNPGAQNNTVGSGASLAIKASDANNDVLTYSATGLPAGLVINSQTGIISGVPTTAGSTAVTVTVSDGKISVSAAFAWNVSAQSTTLQSTPIIGGTGGSLFTDSVSATQILTGINLRSGTWLDSIQGVTNIGALAAHGGIGGTAATVTWPSNEYLVRVHGAYGTYNGGVYVSLVSFITNTGRVLGPYGTGQGGQNVIAFDRTAPAGNAIIGFTGRSDNSVEAIGVLYRGVDGLIQNTAIVGGASGNTFADAAVASQALTGINIRSGTWLDSIQGVTNTGALAVHGGIGGTAATVTWPSNEYLVRVHGAYGTYNGGVYVSVVSFITNTGRTLGPYGTGQGGQNVIAFDSTAPAGNAIVGFTGRSDNSVEAIGILYSSVGNITLSSGIVGGVGGNVFSDTVSANQSLTSINIQAGLWLDNIQGVTNTGALSAHGGGGGTAATVTWPSNEYLVRVYGVYGSYIGQISFVTNTGRVMGPYGTGQGGQNATAFDYTVPTGKKIVGFTGRSDTYLEGLGVLYR